MPERTPLPLAAKDHLETLRPALKDAKSGLSREQATAKLKEEGFDEGEIPYYLEVLLERGYIYSVKGDLFLTDP